jgi:putative hemolysin
MPEVPGGAWSLLILLLALQALNGLFVAAETSVALLRPMHVKHLKDKGEKRGLKLQALLDGQNVYAAACQLGSRLSHVAILFVTMFLAASVAPWMASWVAPWFTWDPEKFGTVLGVAAILLVFPILPMTLTIEHGFRVYSVVHPHGVALSLHMFAVIASAILRLPAHWYTGFAKLISARLSKAELAVANRTEQEIKTLVESAEESGEIEAEEKKLLHSVFEFTDTVAREVMTPRVDMDAMPITSDLTEVMKLVHESGHSRIPIFEGTDDQIVGIVHAKDLLMATSGRAPSLRSLIRPAYFVPENKPLQELLKEMRVNRSQMAVVQDEFGGTAGVVTIEDIVEELVGEIVDEYDVEEPDVVAVENGWSVDGRMHMDDLNSEIGSEFDSEEFDTVGGLVFGTFGRQPKVRESVDIDGYRFTVVHTDGRRVNRLMVERLEPEGSESTDRAAV